jgi:hypothetical protein
MFELFAGLQQGLFEEGARLIQASLLALAVGVVAERLVDTGVRARGIPLLCGLTGVYVGAWLWRLAEWNAGPHVAGHALLPALLGTFAATLFVKLVGLGMAGPRR